MPSPVFKLAHLHVVIVQDFVGDASCCCIATKLPLELVATAGGEVGSGMNTGLASVFLGDEDASSEKRGGLTSSRDPKPRNSSIHHAGMPTVTVLTLLTD